MCQRFSNHNASLYTISKNALYAQSMSLQGPAWVAQSSYQRFFSTRELLSVLKTLSLLQPHPHSRLSPIPDSKPASCTFAPGTERHPDNRLSLSHIQQTVSAKTAANMSLQSMTYQHRYSAPLLPPQRTRTQRPQSIPPTSGPNLAVSSFSKLSSTK